MASEPSKHEGGDLSGTGGDGPGERGAAVRIPPPIIPVLMLVVGLVTDRALGPLFQAPAGVARFLVGAFVLGAGIFLLLAAAGLFRETGQDPKPWEPSPELITDGIYRFTRNPMYVGMGAAQAGLGVLFASLWPLALVPITWGVIYAIAIRHEEAYLGERFGDAYRDYCGRVRRWL